MADVAWLGTVVSVLVAFAVIGVVLALVTDDREPSIVLAWLFLIVLIPVVGVVAYFFVGRNYRREPRRRVRRVGAPAARELASVGAGAGDLAAPPAEKLAGSPSRRVEELGRREGDTEPALAESIRLYFAGADKFRDLLEDLSLARDYVHLMYLIWEQDELTAQVTDVLLERLRAGVEVNILYDWLSSSPYKKHELHRLAEAGAAVVPCYRRLRQLNYRNHMKMAIVDGRVVYSGGMNMGQEYIDGGSRFASWRDTHFRMTGPVVAPYLSLFAVTWASNGRSEDLYAGHLPPPAPAPTGVPVQVLHSSVSTRFSTIRDAFIVALTSARERVWVQTPYFVPDEPLTTAMCVAAASGVDVRLMMTGLPDKKVPFHAAHAYFAKVLQAGVRVHQYDAGFMHAKTVTVDEELVLVGTCNWDIRSLILHDEAMAVVYDGPTARRFADQYLLDLASCHEVTAEALDALSAVRSARNSVCRLMSRLL